MQRRRSYRIAAAVLSKDYKEFMVCDAEHGLLASYPCYKGEIVGFLEDGSVILSSGNRIIKADGFGKEEGEVLFESGDSLYRILMKGDEMAVTTQNEHGLMQLFLYHLKEDSCEKLANIQFMPEDFNEDYVAGAGGAGGGWVELIDRRTGKARMFAAK